MAKEDETKYFNVCKIGTLNIVVFKDIKDGLVKEKMFDSEEIKEVQLSKWDEFSEEVRNYLKGI